VGVLNHCFFLESCIARERTWTALVAVATILVGCAKYVEVPPANLGGLEARSGDKYRVTTRNGLAFTVTSFEVHDSTLVVREVKPRTSEESATTPDTPFSVPFSDIARMELVTVNKGRSVLVAGAVTAVIAGGLYWLWSSLPY
jgi:hypothetical protein